MAKSTMFVGLYTNNIQGTLTQPQISMNMMLMMWQNAHHIYTYGSMHFKVNPDKFWCDSKQCTKCTFLQILQILQKLQNLQIFGKTAKSTY